MEATHGLVPDWPGNVTDFGTKIKYRCKNGMKFKDNFTLEYVESECKDGNVWEPNETQPLLWKECVETNFCDAPDQPPTDGSVIVHNAGLRYGTVCAGENGLDTSLQPGSGCGAITIEMTSPVESGSTMTRWYQIKIPVAALNAGGKEYMFMALTFSQPVNSSTVTASGLSATLSETVTSNVVTISMQMIQGFENVLTISVAHQIGDQAPCLIRTHCHPCDVMADCNTYGDAFDIFDYNNNTYHMTKLEYKCKDGQNFQDSSKTNYTSLPMECQWNGDFTPIETLTGYTCVAYKCTNPPVPTSDLHLIREYDENYPLIDFGQNVTYRCETGYYFENDKEQELFMLQCNEDGTWSQHLPWQKCVHPDELYCFDPPPASSGVISSFTADQSGNLAYGSTVTYSCELHRHFKNFATLETYDQRTIKCLWDKTWDPPTIDPCILKRCVNVLEAPNLYHDYDPLTAVMFGYFLNYKCNPGYYFQNDRSRVDYPVKCIGTLDGGYFDYDSNWPPSCLTDINCGNPPEKPATGTRYWNGNDNYGDQSVYTCGPHAKFFNEDTDQMLDEIISVCQWDTTWSVTSFPECVNVECIVPPTVSANTGLTLLEDENDFELLPENDYLLYNRGTPYAMPASPGFATGDMVMLIDGTLHEYMSDAFVVTLTDRNGLIAFKLTLYDGIGEIKVENSFTAPPKVSISKLSPGEPFFLRVFFDPSKMEFTVLDNYFEETFFEIQPGIADLSSLDLLVSGSLDLHVFGFVEPDYVHTYPADYSLIYGCENDTLDFINVHINLQSFPVKCDALTGQFEPVDVWPICGSCN